MKLFVAGAALSLIITACGTKPEASSLKEESSPNHITATNCEIFVDKIAAATGSHGASTLFPYIKVLKDRLDGDIAEVGFRSQATYRSHGRGDVPEVNEWHNVALESRSPVGDYWTITYGLNVITDFNTTSLEGVFYVKTTKGTYYWAKPTNGNFVFDKDGAHTIYQKYPFGNYSSAPDHAIRTQDSDGMSYYNPSRCY